MTEEDLWEKAKKKSKTFRNGIFPFNYSKEMEKILGKRSIWPVNSLSNKGEISLWLAIACLAERIKLNEVNSRNPWIRFLGPPQMLSAIPPINPPVPNID